jgi:hypothetical protein
MNPWRDRRWPCDRRDEILGRASARVAEICVGANGRCLDGAEPRRGTSIPYDASH